MLALVDNKLICNRPGRRVVLETVTPAATQQYWTNSGMRADVARLVSYGCLSTRDGAISAGLMCKLLTKGA